MPKMWLDRRSWDAYDAFVCAGMFAAVSLYWALGGSIGLRGVGGYAARMARSGGATATVAIWATVAVKAAGAILALSLIRRWGEIVPRRWRGGVAEPRRYYSSCMAASTSPAKPSSSSG